MLQTSCWFPTLIKFVFFLDAEKSLHPWLPSTHVRGFHTCLALSRFFFSFHFEPHQIYRREQPPRDDSPVHTLRGEKHPHRPIGLQENSTRVCLMSHAEHPFLILQSFLNLLAHQLLWSLSRQLDKKKERKKNPKESACMGIGNPFMRNGC